MGYEGGIREFGENQLEKGKKNRLYRAYVWEDGRQCYIGPPREFFEAQDEALRALKAFSRGIPIDQVSVDRRQPVSRRKKLQETHLFRPPGTLPETHYVYLDEDRA